MVAQNTNVRVQRNREWIAQVSNNTMILETPVFRVLPSSTAPQNASHYPHMDPCEPHGTTNS